MQKLVKAPDISKCANPECKNIFKRLGEGCLTVLPVEESAAWGLPPQVKQKVVWICDECSARYYVRLDRENHLVQLVARVQPRAA